MTQKRQKFLTNIFNGAIITSFLSIAIPMAITLFDSKSNYGIFTWIFYANLFILWPLVVLSLIGLVSIYFKINGVKRGSEKSSLRILTAVIAILLVYLGSKEVGNRNNKLDIIFKNNSTNTIKHIELFGRGAYTELDSLVPFTDTTLVFRGKAILRNIANDYENEIALLYYCDSTLLRQSILEDFDRWRVLGTGIQIDFFGPDSVQVNYLFEE